MKQNEATEYAVALNNVDETITDIETAQQLAAVFLLPSMLFKLWIDSLIYKYWKL